MTYFEATCSDHNNIDAPWRKFAFPERPRMASQFSRDGVTWTVMSVRKVTANA